VLAGRSIPTVCLNMSVFADGRLAALAFAPKQQSVSVRRTIPLLVPTSLSRRCLGDI